MCIYIRVRVHRTLYVCVCLLVYPPLGLIYVSIDSYDSLFSYIINTYYKLYYYYY